MSFKKDLTGHIINVFEVISDSGERRNGNIIWTCKCIFCGTTKNLNRKNMERNKSCGCRKVSEQRKSIYKGYELISGGHWNTIKKNAESRKLELNITKEYIWDIYIKQDRKCALSGVEITFSKSYADHTGTASLDRIDSKLGYIQGNVQWLHKDVNFMKQQFSTEHFLNWCKKIYLYNAI